MEADVPICSHGNLLKAMWQFCPWFFVLSDLLYCPFTVVSLSPNVNYSILCLGAFFLFCFLLMTWSSCTWNKRLSVSCFPVWMLGFPPVTWSAYWRKPSYQWFSWSRHVTAQRGVPDGVMTLLVVPEQGLLYHAHSIGNIRLLLMPCLEDVNMSTSGRKHTTTQACWLSWFKGCVAWHCDVRQFGKRISPRHDGR